jgi:hypothetical protein
MKVILSEPDEGYSERHLMKVIMSVPDEGYFERTILFHVFCQYTIVKIALIILRRYTIVGLTRYPIYAANLQDYRKKNSKPKPCIV